jgi:hypothetical protein
MRYGCVLRESAAAAVIAHQTDVYDEVSTGMQC